jgi:hypothetical protein
MKKLVVFLILFIVSIPAFAQDESLFAENFSLIKDPGSNNRGFLNFKVSFPSSYLFFNENKRHSRQYQAFQKFRFHQYSKRTPFSRIATVEDGRQNWGDMYSLIYGQQENISSEEESESLAELYLKRTAERSKKRRKTGGTIGLVVGGGLIVLGASITSREQEGWFDLRPIFGYFSIIMGAVCVGGGIYSLAVPSRAERELDDVLSISDRAQRERASHEALSSLAARARRNRILAGIVSAAFAVSSLVGESPEYVYGAPYAALAVYSFVMKSPAERAFQDYLRERKREQQKELVMRVGIGPYGGVKIGFVYSF